MSVRRRPPRGRRASDALTADAVATAASARLGRPCRVLPKVGSTQDEALRWAKKGAPEGALVVAEEQTAGRGRRGRPWLSPGGRSLYVSVVLRPRLSPAEASVLATAAGLAVAEAVESVHHLPTGLKWPNDVVVDGRKIAGILVEATVGVEFVAVVGVGVNVSWPCGGFPAELAPRATSVSCELERRCL